MNEPKSEWQTQELARTFLEGVRGAMPGAAMQFSVLSKIVRQWHPQPARILDLGCGDGILGRFLLDLFPAAHALFVDFSPPMLDAARAKVGSLPQAVVAYGDFSTPAWQQVARPHGPFDIVVSGYAIHHQPDDRKRALYAEIYDLLAPGGAFLNLEHVASATEAGQELFDEFFIDNLLEFHRRSNPNADRDAISASFYKRPDKKENILAPVETQCAWLREVGFSDVDCYLKVFELALLGGRKPADALDRKNRS